MPKVYYGNPIIGRSDKRLVNSAANSSAWHCHFQYNRKELLMQFVVYRRHMKRKISTEMQSRVDDMVSKYIEFYSDRSKK